MTATGPLVLGVDGGGTKTEAIVADADGRILGTGRSGGSNWEAVGLDGMATAVGAAVGEALGAAGIAANRIAAAVLGLAGVDWPDDSPRVRSRLGVLGLVVEPVVVNDAFVALRAGCASRWGAVSNVGTGTVTAAVGRDGTTYRTLAIGWGEPVGAGGLVRDALHAIAAHHQGVGGPTALTDSFLAATGHAGVDALFEALSRRSWRLDAGLAPIVDDVARRGDQVAIELLTISGQRHAAMAVAAAGRVQLSSSPFELVLAGSVHAAASPAFSSAFAETVRAGCPAALLAPLTRAPALGAVDLALDGLRR